MMIRVFVTKKKVSVISKMVDFRKLDSTVHVINVNDKKEGAEDRTLRNPGRDRKGLGLNTVYVYVLESAREVIFEPFKLISLNS